MSRRQLVILLVLALEINLDMRIDELEIRDRSLDLDHLRGIERRRPVMGKHLDRRDCQSADELLGSPHPFRRASTTDTMAAILRDPPDLSGDLPQGLMLLIRRLLAKSLEDRYQSIADVRADLGRLTASALVQEPQEEAEGRIPLIGRDCRTGSHASVRENNRNPTAPEAGHADFTAAADGGRSGKNARRLGTIPIRTMRPILHTGHRLSSCSSTLLRLSGTVGLVCGTAPSNARQSASFFPRARLARKPNWRMRTKPLGRTCSGKRRMNSVASRIMTFV